MKKAEIITYIRDIFREKDLNILHARLEWYEKRRKVVLQVQSHSEDPEVLDRIQDLLPKFDAAISEIEYDINRCK